MNTKHTRVVMALLLAVASLATMGFSAPFDESDMASIWPDHATCQLIDPALSAAELLEFVGDHCFESLIDQVETEIDLTFTGTGSSTLLQEWFSESGLADTDGSVEYLEILERSVDALAGPSVSFSARPTAESIGWVVALSGPSASDVPLAGVYTNARTPDALLQSLVESGLQLAPRVGFGGPSADDVPLSSVYTHASTGGLIERSPAASSSDYVRVGFDGPSAIEVWLDNVYTNARPGALSAQAQDELAAAFGWRGGFSGPSYFDVPLVSVYTHAGP